MPRTRERFLLVFVLLYTIATCLHFVHNGVYVHDYPNMPGWIGRADVALGLGGVLAIGLAGWLLYAKGWQRTGLLVLAAYAALGFDGLAALEAAASSASKSSPGSR